MKEINKKKRWAETCSELCQISKMEKFAKILKGFQLLLSQKAPS